MLSIIKPRHAFITVNDVFIDSTTWMLCIASVWTDPQSFFFWCRPRNSIGIFPIGLKSIPVLPSKFRATMSLGTIYCLKLASQLTRTLPCNLLQVKIFIKWSLPYLTYLSFIDRNGERLPSPSENAAGWGIHTSQPCFQVWFSVYQRVSYTCSCTTSGSIKGRWVYQLSLF